MSKIGWWCLAIVGLLLVYAPFGAAQTNKAQITGIVEDATGAVIPDAEIRVLHVETGTQNVVRSNNEGVYSVPLLDAGNYRLTVRKQGFRTIERSNILLQVDQVARIDFTLDVGAETERVEVTAAAPLVDRETATMGTVVSSTQIEDLPLNSRNPFRMAFIAPGLIPMNNYADTYSGAAAFTISGGSPGLNQIYIDGATDSVPEANQGMNDVSLLPSPDALEEFKVETNNYSAEYGRGTGIINVVLKSGTNGLHGSLYEFLRNSDMDSNNFFSNRSGKALPSFKRNEFGLAVGGPIVHDRAFFFVNYEGLRQGTQSTDLTTVPTALQLQGNFSQIGGLVGGQCQPVQIYDPATTTPSGSAYVRQPFPNATIPASRLDKVGSAIAAFYPAPDQAGAACTGANNFFSSQVDALGTDQGDAKLDWYVTSKDRLTWGVSWRRSDEFLPNFYGNYASPGYGLVGDAEPKKGTRLDYTRTQSGSLVFNLRFDVNRLKRVTPPPSPADYSQASLGLPAFVDAQMRKPVSFPIVSDSDGGGFGPSWAYVFWSSTVYSWHASAMWVKGKHTLKFGTEVRANQVFEDTGLDTSGNYSFGRGFTQGPNPNASSSIGGNGIASLLLGLGTGLVNYMPPVLTSNHYFALYAQDDFKVSSRLTLNLGLRYDVEPGRSERFNQLSWFNFTAPSPLASQVGLPNLQGGLEFPGANGNPDSQFQTAWHDLGPRLGLAYSLNPKTVVRAGYGLTYLPFIGAADGQSSGLAGFSSITTWTSSLDGVTPLNYLSNPYPAGLTPPTGSSLGLASAVGQALSGGDTRGGAIDSGNKVGNLQQWNVNVQRELLPGLSGEVAYVGTKGTHLTDTWDLNQLNPQYLSLGTALEALVPNPFYGFIKTGTLSGPTVAEGQLLRPYPQFLDTYYYRNADASSIYHALQARIQKRFADGSTIVGAYTNSKSLDDVAGAVGYSPTPGHQNSYDRSADRSLSGFDVSQRLVVSAVYALPLGLHRRFGAGWGRGVDAVLGNWKANAILTLQTGTPITVSAANNCNCYLSNNVERPNVNGDPNLPSSRSTTAKLAEWFNTSVFSQPAPFTLGNAGRFMGVRSAGIRNLDFSLFKEIPFGEKWHVEFRGEAYNLFNTPQFGLPATGLTSATFGVVSSQLNIPRQIQLGLKVIF